MKEETVVLDGELIPKNQANISVFDKGYYFDFCVYTSLKFVGKTGFFLEYHVDRLFDSAKLIGINHNYKKEEIIDWINKLRKANDYSDVLLRIILIGDAEKNQHPKLFIFKISNLHYYDKKDYSEGVKVITYIGEREMPQSKTKNLLINYLGYTNAEKAGAIDALLIDRDGYIREGTASNFFAIKGDYLISPPKEKILEGITKKILIEISKDFLEFKYEDIPLKDILEDRYDELIITSTSKNIMPIKQIDNKIFVSDFLKTKELEKRFKEYLEKYLSKNS